MSDAYADRAKALRPPDLFRLVRLRPWASAGYRRERGVFIWELSWPRCEIARTATLPTCAAKVLYNARRARHCLGGSSVGIGLRSP